LFGEGVVRTDEMRRIVDLVVVVVIRSARTLEELCVPRGILPSKNIIIPSRKIL
jgi:hypothetical protein